MKPMASSHHKKRNHATPRSSLSRFSEATIAAAALAAAVAPFILSPSRLGPFHTSATDGGDHQRQDAVSGAIKQCRTQVLLLPAIIP